MGRRWVAMAFALMPVVFVPACFGTRAALIWKARTEVKGAPFEEYPLLAITGKPGHRSVAIVTSAAALTKYRAGHPDTTLRSAPGEEAQIEKLVRALRGLDGWKPDPENPFRAIADLRDQQVHVAYYREGAIGAMWFESWYDTDGTKFTPRYERQYSPTWMLMGAALLAVPGSFLLGGAVARLLLFRRRALPAPNALMTRLIAALLLYAAVAVPLAGMTMPVGIGALIVVASAAIAWVVPWKRRRLVIAFLLLAVAGVIVAMVNGEAAGIALIFGFGLAVLFGTAYVIERSLAAALKIHATPEAHPPSPA